MSAEETGRRLRDASSVLLVNPHSTPIDLLVSTPVLRNLRAALPEARLVFVAGRDNASAVLDNPDLDEVVVLRRRGPAAAWSFLSTVRRLRREGFDGALNLSTTRHSPAAVTLTRWARPGWVAGFDDTPFRGRTARLGYDCVVPLPEDPRIHNVDMNLSLLERLGVPVADRRHRVGVTDAQRSEAERALTEAGLDPRLPILGVQAGGSPLHPDRHWPPSHYAAVLQRAAGEFGYQPVLLGRSADRPTLDAVLALGRTPVPMLLDLPFPVYKGVLDRLTFFLTHDGLPVHLAAGVGVPGYYVLLSTPPWRGAPYGSHVSVWEEFGRSPSSAEVWERARPLMEAALE